VTTSEQLTTAQSVGIDPERLEGLLTRARREIDEGLLPACQLAVAKDGQLVASATFGDATDDDRFLMYSSTKTFVASAVWKLMSEGGVTLDQRVAEILPPFGANGKDAITVEQLLHHTAGFPSAFLNPYDWDDVEKRNATFASWPLEWEPGSRYSYHSLSSSWVQAAIVDAITGRDYREYLRTEILDPLRLTRFALGVPTDQQSDIMDVELRGEMVTVEELNAAWGMTEIPAGWVSQGMLLTLNAPGWRAVGIPAGGAVSTASDVAMFYQHVLANTGDIWSRAVLDAVIDNATESPDDMGVPTSRGLGCQVNGSGAVGDMAWWYGFGKGNSSRAFGHDGAGGQIAWVDPETGLSFCYLTNGLDENILRQKRRMLAIGSRATSLMPDDSAG
jgi:CubicO group peptidase (beta-lactamase class C family)